MGQNGEVLELLLNKFTLMRFTIILLLTITCALSYAQNSPHEGFFNKTKLGVLLRLKTEPVGNSQLSKLGNGTEITTINGLHINSKWAIGLGISANSYINPTLTLYPVFANVHYYFKDEIKTPFLFGNIGYNMLFDSSYKGGLMYETGLGYNLKLGRKTALTPEISYKYQDYRISDSSNQKLSLQSFSLGIGILF
ncbi:MAG: hypothetical protein EAZ15_07305 [Sphingobacteriales bacterium]|nr:MAG: hypothetical protein EAZ15_07305 [Sphingobacteriales bacterium]